MVKILILDNITFDLNLSSWWSSNLCIM